ncbi:glycerol-3-phosphate acyltransferase [Methylobacterium indicum]|uniref:glycerol-3-phosphate 1-O-acyltransferase PlsY n=1 Tax=Methylobacterium indicum TaxID=1775910 RepID=UPI000734B4D1|nr:glycerol-3-phosphate 1-O-acyltransferase PlsY [Methylobacterium indicum]KTS23036.1 glycerol-3-phosphate acyltransferase [Methylobacterium indicum]KTS30341.1 glycerol-3-phosphate acyltransferase [Methylobacterium indicum]KTS49386.1 glycerol-3-phosphate acyltransferase [Methylobacterium indicum]
MTPDWTPIAPWLVVGYLFGAIPFGLILTRFAGLGDVRAIGSGNIGATNVLRTGRKGLAAATLLGDALKGTVAVLLASRFGGSDAALAAGLGAFLGHLFPVWLGFKGGKGVATFIGVLLGLFPLGVLVFAVIWLGLAFLLRYSSASALAASAATPVALWALGQGRLAVLFCVLALLLWWKHAPNIRRLLAGTEGRIGQKG